jgi:hypothetical protein
LRDWTSASFPLSEAFKLLISERKLDFKLSSSLGVIDGILRGVGAGGMSKSRRFDIREGVAEVDPYQDMSGIFELFK